MGPVVPSRLTAGVSRAATEQIPPSVMSHRISIDLALFLKSFETLTQLPCAVVRRVRHCAWRLPPWLAMSSGLHAAP